MVLYLLVRYYSEPTKDTVKIIIVQASQGHLVAGKCEHVCYVFVCLYVSDNCVTYVASKHY
jgi:hypothetical protein